MAYACDDDDAALDAARLEASPRPRTWGECEVRGLGTPEEPCPYVSCVYHLALNVSETTGEVQVVFPDREPDALPETCALRVAQAGGVTLERIAGLMNLTRERVRQIENKALLRLRGDSADDLGGSPEGVAAAPGAATDDTDDTDDAETPAEEPLPDDDADDA